MQGAAGADFSVPVNMSKPKKRAKQTMGAHWKETGYSPLYQLYRRVETVASQLEKRRQSGWIPTKAHIEELDDIAVQLKVLDSEKSSRQ